MFVVRSGSWTEFARCGAEGVSRFLELGPDGVLTAMARQAFDDDGGLVFVPALRARLAEAETFAGFLAQAHIAGVDVDWPTYYAGARRTRAADLRLPARPLLARRPAPEPATRPAPGLNRLDHPLLSAAVPIGDRDEWVFTGRLSQDSAPWIRDHVVLGKVIVPGTALVELALAAGRHAGCPVIDELVLEAPADPAGHARRCRSRSPSARPDEDGRRDGRHLLPP